MADPQTTPYRAADFSQPPTGRCSAEVRSNYTRRQCYQHASTWRSGAPVCGTHARSSLLKLWPGRDV